MRYVFLFAIILIVLVVCLLPFALCRAMAFLCRTSPFWHLFWRSLGILSSLCVAFALCYGYIWGSERLVTTQYTYAHPQIPPAFDGYRIVQISDWHLGTFANRRDIVENVVEHINALNPDLIVFTGDLVNFKAEEAEHFEAILARIHAQDGIISIMGNHDYMMYRNDISPKDRYKEVKRLQDLQQRIGWRLLLNEHYMLERGNERIAIVGLENNGDGIHVPEYDRYLNDAFDGVPRNNFSILLSHNPAYWRSHVLPNSTAQLQLAGHTHAMQLQIFGWSPSSWIYKNWYGRYDDWGNVPASADGMSGATAKNNKLRSIIVSRGIGSVGIPFRLGAWPELVEITLKRI